MAGSLGRGQRGLESEPNVIPMIDVLLVLLIIFMLAQNVRHAIDVQVPPLAAQPVGHAPTQIVLELLPGTGYAINGQPVPEDRLEAVLDQIYSARVSKLLFLKAAPDRIYQEVVAAMDRSRGVGVQVIGFMPPLLPVASRGIVP